MRILSAGLTCLLLHAVDALYVLPSSSCAQTCNVGESTVAGDLVCSDDQFFNSSIGNTFRECSICEVQSLAYNGTLSDQYWALFHIKWTQNFCLFELSPPTDSIDACATACAPLRVTLAVNPIGEVPWKDQYEYCSDDSKSYTKNGPSCAQCLQAQAGSVVIGNFMETMVDLCQDRPYASKSLSIQTARDLYDTSTIPISTTISASSVEPTSALSTNTVPTSSLVNTISVIRATTTSNAVQTSGVAAAASAPSAGLSTGAKAGIGIACALVGVALITVITWVVLRTRKSVTGNEYKFEREELSDSSPSELGGKQAYLEIGEGKIRSELDTFASQRPQHQFVSKIPAVEMAG